ncbi:hypothetical protein MBLNU230_g3097t1 [Neophaeotheca triangularis]
MPPAASRRMKGLKISRNFIIGNEAYELPHPLFPSPPEGHTKGWKVYIRPLPNGPDITTWLRKVQFKLHHTYPDPSRTVEAPGPYEVLESGYGEFNVEMRLYFPGEAGEKACYREHYLILSAYGPPEQQEMQTKANRIVSERMETIDFNEPTQDFYKTMTNEEQFNWLKVKKGRGKGKKPDMVFEGAVEPTAQLPEVKPDKDPGGNGSGGAFSLEYEKQILAMLSNSAGQLDDLIGEEKKAAEERRKKLAELAAA